MNPKAYVNANHMYETVQILQGVTPITSKPVVHIKRDQDGKIE